MPHGAVYRYRTGPGKVTWKIQQLVLTNLIARTCGSGTLGFQRVATGIQVLTHCSQQTKGVDVRVKRHSRHKYAKRPKKGGEKEQENKKKLRCLHSEFGSPAVSRYVLQRFPVSNSIYVSRR